VVPALAKRDAKAILSRLKELAGGSDYILPAGPQATVNPEIGSNPRTKPSRDGL
jgi:hypothetical protein